MRNGCEFDEVLGRRALKQLTSIEMSAADLESVKEIVGEHFLRRCLQCSLDKLNFEDDLSFDEQLGVYCERVSDAEHSACFPKEHRVLPEDLLNRFLELQFLEDLRCLVGDFVISGESGLAAAEVYWRLTRAGMQQDAGPAHCDHWFWRLNGWETESHLKPLKVWIPLIYEPGISGLKIWPAIDTSQLNFQKRITDDGKVKPDFDSSALDGEAFEIFDRRSGSLCIFGGMVMHQGLIGVELPRVSIEFTALVNREYFFNKFGFEVDHCLMI